MTYISLSLAKNYLIGEGGVQLPNTEPYVVFLGGFRVYSDSFWKMSTRANDKFQGTKGVMKIHKSKIMQWPK